MVHVPVPEWLTSFRNAYPGILVGALARAIISPRQATLIDTGAGPLTRGKLFKSLLFSLVPLALITGVLSLLWWYVVIHQQVSAPEIPPELVPLGGTPLPEAPTDTGPSTNFLIGFWGTTAVLTITMLRYYLRMDGARLEVIRLLTTSILPLAMLTITVLSVILFGITTATESAAVGAAGAFLLAIIAGTMTWERTKEAVFLTAKTTSMVCWLFVGSALFSGVFAILGGQALIEGWVLSLNLSPIQFMILSQVIIFLLGWPLEWTEIIVIFVPIFLPLLQHFSIDPILWGILVFVNLQAAFLSPPVAMSAFYLKGVAPKHVTLNQIFLGMMPYMLIVIICMLFLYLWPGLALWLPSVLYGP